MSASQQRELDAQLRSTARRVRDAGAAVVDVLPLGADPYQRGKAAGAPADVVERWLRQPLRVLVENRLCDGRLVHLVLLLLGEAQVKRRLGTDAYQRLRASWWEGHGCPWLRLEHGGGSGVPGLISAEVEFPDQLPPRLVVVVDSDRSAPPADAEAQQPPWSVAEQTLAAWARLQRSLPDWPLARVTVLQKRAVENYIPGEVLNLTHRREYPRWAALSPDEKDHADLKLLFGDRGLCCVLDRAQPGMHARTLRERAGRKGAELDQLLHRILDAL